MADGLIKRRRRQPRVGDNPMALLAQRVMVEASDAFRTADELAAAMEPHLLKQLTNSAIYQYTNARTVAPGDILLAAALSAGLSLDEKLGMARQANDIQILRDQVAEMREEMAAMRSMMAGSGGTAAKQPAEAEAGSQDRAARRRTWAEHPRGAATPPGGPPPSRRSGRSAQR